MSEFDSNQAERRGLGKVKRVLLSAKILHEGWEMDNDGWVCEMEDGSIKGFTTSHGGVCEWPFDEVDLFISETKKSLYGLEACAALLSGAKK